MITTVIVGLCELGGPVPVLGAVAVAVLLAELVSFCAPVARAGRQSSALEAPAPEHQLEEEEGEQLILALGDGALTKEP